MAVKGLMTSCLQRGASRDGDPRRWGKGELYLSLQCHHQDDFCIQMGSESHFNVSLTVRDKVTRLSIKLRWTAMRAISMFH